MPKLGYVGDPVQRQSFARWAVSLRRASASRTSPPAIKCRQLSRPWYSMPQTCCFRMPSHPSLCGLLLSNPSSIFRAPRPRRGWRRCLDCFLSPDTAAIAPGVTAFTTSATPFPDVAAPLLVSSVLPLQRSHSKALYLWPCICSNRCKRSSACR